jgi:hypothetical protein
MSQSVPRATAQVGTCSRLIRGSMSDGHLRCTASDRRCAPARPASHVWNASLGVSAEPARPSADSCPTRQITGFQGLSMNWRLHRLHLPWACYARRAGTCMRLEAPLHRMLLSDVPPRFARERVPTTSQVASSVDVLRRTRRNVYAIRGAAPDVTIGRPAAVRAGARPYHMMTRPALPVLKNAKGWSLRLPLENRQRASL